MERYGSFVSSCSDHCLRLISLNSASRTVGGPMFWADNYVGLPALLRELEAFHKLYPDSEYFRPSALLRRCVDLGMGVQEYYRRGLANSAGVSKL